MVLSNLGAAKTVHKSRQQISQPQHNKQGISIGKLQSVQSGSTDAHRHLDLGFKHLFTNLIVPNISVLNLFEFLLSI